MATPMMHCVCFSSSLERLGPRGESGGGAVIFWADLSPKPEGPRSIFMGLVMSGPPSVLHPQPREVRLAPRPIRRLQGDRDKDVRGGRGHAVCGGLTTGRL